MLDTEGCLNCGRGLHEFCNSCECCLPETNGGISEDKNANIARPKESNKRRAHESSSDGETEQPERGRPVKSPEDIKDRHSTGRKRAAVLFPIFADEACEWRSLSNCGGGKYPIIGCVDGKQQHRHHGPNKDPLRNNPGNVHRICDNCHNIWHSQNDKDYHPDIKHNPRPATTEELADRAMKIRYVSKN